MLRRLFAVAAVVILAVSTASAKPEPPEKAEARKHYAAGLAHFNLREYRQAIDEFQAAYRAVPDPVFLYNLGQSYRLADDAEQALYFYRAYLRTAPDSSNRPEVEERIATLEKTVAQGEQRRPKPPAEPQPPPSPLGAQNSPQSPDAMAVTATPPTPAPHRPVYKRWWFWAIGAAIVAGGAVGLGVGLGAQKTSTFDANLGTFGPRAVTVRF